MKLKSQSKTTPTPILFLFISTAVALSGCNHIPIKDAVFCSPIPGPQNLGAVCDNLFTKNQMILSAELWNELQTEWAEKGQTVECTSSNAIGDIKAEVEKLCSVAPCDYKTEQKIIKGLSKIQALGRIKKVSNSKL